MAIVLKYGSPGPLLQAEFAAGVGKRKKDQTDDLLKVWQQQTQQGFQANQAALARQQQVGLQLQHQNFQADQQTLQNYQADKSRFQQQDFQASQADLNRKQVQGHYEDLQHQTTLKGLASGALELPLPAQKELQKLEEGRVLVQGPGWTDQDRAQFTADYEKRKRALYQTAVPKTHTDPAAEENRATVYRDQQGKAYNEPGEGRIPYLAGTGKAIENPQLKAQAEAQVKQQAEQQKQQKEVQKQQEKAQAEVAKQAEKFQAANEKWLEKRHATALRIQNDTTPAGSLTKPALDFDAAEKEMNAAGFAKPQPPAQPQQAGMTQGQYGDGQHGEPVERRWNWKVEGNQWSLDGKVVGMEGGVVKIKTEYGTLPVPITDLSKEDQDFLSQQNAATSQQAPSPELVQQMKDNGAKDPARAAALYQKMKSGEAGGPKTPGELALYQRDQAAKARDMGIAGSSTLEDPRATGEGSEYADQSGKKYKMINGTWKRIQ
jgi:hypothetical protein